MGRPITVAIGDKHNRLTVVSRQPSPDDRTRWECICECGNTIIVKSSSLTRGTTKSCGCLKLEMLIARNRATKTRHGMAREPIYAIWFSMLARCRNPKHAAYADYGGRGITVCERWNDFTNFYEDMGNQPKGLTLDRIDNDKGYCKENCRWATWIQQANNRRPMSQKRKSLNNHDDHQSGNSA